MQRPITCLVAVVLAGGQASHECVEDDGAPVLRALAINRAPARGVAVGKDRGGTNMKAF